jgi:hypothetical protein
VQPVHSLAGLASKQGFVYPAPMAALFVPLAVLPYSASLAIWLVVSVVSIAVGLRVLGVRDWRCFGALFLTHPVLESVRLGTLMPVLMLLLALLWRYRDRIVLAAMLAAMLALSKVFLFPLLLWLVATRRFRTAALGAILAVGLCVLGWIPIHLSTMVFYPVLLHALAVFEQTFSYSLTSLAVGIGVSSGAATAIAWAVGAALLALALTVGAGNDFLALRLSLAACFVISPIVWGHYYVLLAVPLALRWPRLSPVWLAAIWIRSDTLALPHPPMWVALALLVMVLQLDLAWPRGARRLVVWGTPRVRSSIGAALALALLVASGAAAAVGDTRVAALLPTDRRSAASGAASIRVDRPDAQICWRLWTEAFPPRVASIMIESTSGDRRPLILRARIGRSGDTQGCAPIGRTDVALTRDLVARPHHYRLVIAVPDGALITGRLHSS